MLGGGGGAEKASKASSGLGDLLWATAELGEASLATNTFEKLPARSLGKEAYAVLLRDAGRGSALEVAILRHMADNHCANMGLRAAVLNAAASRCLAAGNVEAACDVLEDMVQRRLWTPVTFRIADHVVVAGGNRIDGAPDYPGLVDPGAGAHKYTRALYHALGRASPGDVDAALDALEDFSRSKGWLKFGAADEKGRVLDEALRRFARAAPAGGGGVALELGTFLGYSAARMARELSGTEARIVSLECDPEVACLAMNFLDFAGVGSRVDVRIGHCEDLMPRLAEEFGPQSVGFVYMDHNQMAYHEDLARLESLGALTHEAFVVATQVLKPGAPLLLWRLVEAERRSRLAEPLELVSSPDCGCPLMEDWVAIARLRAAPNIVPGDEQPWAPTEPPLDVQFLAAECNLMRWRTVHGLVDERRWNAFVQHVRRRVERLIGVRATRGVWPVEGDPLARAQRLEFRPFDF